MSKTIENILIGCDPELFVFDHSIEECISAHDLVPGSKSDPYLVKSGAVQPDGVAAEFNIQPAHNEDEFVNHINTVRARLQEIVQQKGGQYLELIADPTAFFSEKYFSTLPVEALALGCEPDMNAYTEDFNTPPKTSEPFRTGSGHIHIGFTQYESPMKKEHLRTCIEIVKQLDAVLFATSHTWDPDQKRRELYGNRGAFRPKSYGVEYRPLSNAWLRDELTTRFVYRAAKNAVDLYFAGVKLYV